MFGERSHSTLHIGERSQSMLNVQLELSEHTSCSASTRRTETLLANLVARQLRREKERKRARVRGGHHTSVHRMLHVISS
jgi:hypothetical protein